MLKQKSIWERNFKKNPDFISRKIADEIVLIPLKKNASELEAIYNLNNEVSVRIWELINGKRKLKDIRDILLKEFSVDEKVLKKDLEVFIKDLEKIEAVG